MTAPTTDREGTEIPELTNLFIYLVDECNLNCRHCWLSLARQSRHATGSPSLHDYMKVVHDAAECGAKLLKITGGEPLLKKALAIDLLSEAHSLGMNTALETNGMLVDRSTAVKLAKLNTAVSVSLDGSNADLHEDIRQVKGSFEAALRGLRVLESCGARLDVIMSLHRGNCHDLTNMLTLIASIQGCHLKVNPINILGRAEEMAANGELLTIPEFLEFIQILEVESIRLGVRSIVMATPAFYPLSSIVRHYTGCSACSFCNLLSVLADGTIAVCGMGYDHKGFTFGNIGSTSIRDVWTQNEELVELRRRLGDGFDGVCANCTMNSVCRGGCRADAFAAYASITAPPPQCQQLYDSGLFPVNRLIDMQKLTPYPPASIART